MTTHSTTCLTILASLVLGSSACAGIRSPSNEDSRILDGGLISHQPCAPPCFWGITPGQTSYEEARELLENRAVGCHEHDASESKGISCEMPGEGYMRGLGSVGVGLASDGESVSFVAFGPSTSINVSDVVALYGDPDAVIVSYESRPDPQLVDFGLIFEDPRMILFLPYKEGFTYRLLQADDVISVTYGSAQEQQEAMDFWALSTQPWRGFTEYTP